MLYAKKMGLAANSRKALTFLVAMGLKKLFIYLILFN